MSMGYCGSFAETIEPVSIMKFCKKEYSHFVDVLTKLDIDIDEFARDMEYNDIEHYSADVTNAYKNLQEAFRKKTKLTLFIAFHDADNEGDKYDEINGSYWAINHEEMYQLTPAGKKISRYVTTKNFVTFG